MADMGCLIDGRYEVINKIGQGGMSVVYLAKDTITNSQFAIKEIKKIPDNKNSEIMTNSLLVEAELIKRLNHQTLPEIVDIIEEENTIYLIMEFIEGRPLDQVLEIEGAQPQELVIDWAKQLCGVLNYLHNQKPPIIYRDMKPANIMLKPDGTIKLIDFGIAREYKEENMADTINLGTKGYAAPEQFGGIGQTDARTDIYCLGVTLYHLVTGMNPCEPPYEIYPIRNWNSNLSTGFEKIIQKCTQRNPEDRYQSCAEVLYDLKHYKKIDMATKNKKLFKIKAEILIIFLSLITLFVGSAILKENNKLASYLLIFSAIGIISSIIFGIKVNFIKLCKEIFPKDNKGIPNPISKMNGDNNLTTLLNYEDGTTLLENNVLDEAIIINKTNVHNNFNNDECNTTILDITEDGTQLLSENTDNIQTLNNNEAINNIKTNNIKTNNIKTNHDLNINMKNEKNTSILKNNDFIIIESITLVNTKEEIA